MTKAHYVKMSWLKEQNLQHCLQNANNLMMLAESSANIDHAYSSPTVRRTDAKNTSGVAVHIQSSPSLIDEEDECPLEIDTIHPTIEADTSSMRNAPTLRQESNHRNSTAKFTWTIHVDKILMDYCSYFLNADGSISDDKWVSLTLIVLID
jgi:hypothetical protein